MNIPRPSPDIQTLLPLKPLEFSILLALCEEDLHGYAITKRVADREVGAVELAPGNLYAVIDRMIAAGWIESRARRRQGDARRRYFGITALGRRVAAAEASRLEELMLTIRRLDLLPSRRAGK